jgi:hypothetical protein
MSVGSTESAGNVDHARSCSDTSCIGVHPQLLAKAFEPSRAVGSDSGQRQPERLGSLGRSPLARLDEPDNLTLSSR